MSTPTTPDQKTIFFYGMHRPNGEFSQFYKSPFTVDGVTYHCAEQWYHARKAEYFNDEATKAKILNAKSPLECKRLGKRVKNFDREQWNQVAYGFVKQGSMYKFTISEKKDELKAFLLATGDLELAEAAPRDRIWGIGCGASTANTKREKWGKNLLGKILMEVRDDLRALAAAQEDDAAETAEPEASITQ